MFSILSLESLTIFIDYFRFRQPIQLMMCSLQVRQRKIYKEIFIEILIDLEFQIDLPGVENYGFEGESSFMRCKFGAVASDSEEASKVGRCVYLIYLRNT